MKYSPIGREPESFQRPLAQDRVRALCEQALGPGIEEVREFACGMFNNTYLVVAKGRKAVWRVGPAPGVRVFSNEEHLLRREQSIEPFLVRATPLVPRTIHADFSGRLIERDFVFQTFIEGELWDEVRDSLTPAQNESLWEQLGAIAGRIHRVRGESFGFPPPKKQFGLWSDALLGIARDMVGDIAELGIDPEGTREYLEALEEGRRVLDEIREPSLVHGDLWPKNVLMERGPGGPRIAGLLDSERAFWGDPMAEWIFHDGTCAPAFWKGYGARPQGESRAFRDAAYRGLYAVQLHLEAWRFKQDDAPFRERLAGSVRAMDEALRAR